MGLVLEHSCINRSGESGALRFLDVGCGSGAIAIALLQEGKVEVKKSSDLSVVVGSLLVVTLSARQQIPKRRRVYLVMNCHYCSHCAWCQDEWDGMEHARQDKWDDRGDKNFHCSFE